MLDGPPCHACVCDTGRGTSTLPRGNHTNTATTKTDTFEWLGIPPSLFALLSNGGHCCPHSAKELAATQSCNPIPRDSSSLSTLFSTSLAAELRVSIQCVGLGIMSLLHAQLLTGVRSLWPKALLNGSPWPGQTLLQLAHHPGANFMTCLPAELCTARLQLTGDSPPNHDEFMVPLNRCSHQRAHHTKPRQTIATLLCLAMTNYSTVC